MSRPALPAHRVSRNSKMRADQFKAVRVAIVKHEHEAPVISCSCGWLYMHERVKVRENAAQRHLDKRHGGVGMWM